MIEKLKEVVISNTCGSIQNSNHHGLLGLVSKILQALLFLIQLKD